MMNPPEVAPDSLHVLPSTDQTVGMFTSIRDQATVGIVCLYYRRVMCCHALSCIVMYCHTVSCIGMRFPSHSLRSPCYIAHSLGMCLFLLASGCSVYCLSSP